ncbi:MAG: AraC family transcriptional regulator [Burkholderiales bacterium]|nr:AraC family transcriptional regulator [Burkholderiales bacterium]
MSTPLCPQAITRLWLPPLSLAGCLRAGLLRDTRACDTPPLDNHWPASPYVTIYLFMQGQGRWMEAPGFLPRPPDFALQPLMVGGPFAGPVRTLNDGAVHGLMLSFLPDAFAALTGLPPEALRNRCEPATARLPADWLDWLQRLQQMADDDARLAEVECFLSPRWQALAWTRPAGQRFSDWTEALAVRAAGSASGRSLRQFERRVKAWAGVPLRELRGASRAENAFLQAVAAGGPAWSELALDQGYADQSHLCRETRRLTGFSPSDLRRRIDTDESFWAYRVWR